MKIILDGKINRTYVQSLCTMFFHGEKFPENEEFSEKTLYVKTKDKEDGIFCEIILKVNEKEEKSSSFVPYSENITYEKLSKRAVGKALYEAGSKITGKVLPWGILSGIRPSKVAIDLMEKMPQDVAMDTLKNEYLVSKEKLELIKTVSVNERNITSLCEQDTCSVYISIPFCPSRCAYCSFISYASPKLFSLIPEYLEKLFCDINKTFNDIKEKGLRVLSIYIGGGTPTILSEEQLEKLLLKIFDNIDTNSLMEFTLEAGRPDTITEDKLKIAKKYGITRISVNPQTLNDKVLENIGRKHTVKEFLEAFEKVKKSGIEHINTDLIVGLTGDDFESFKNTIDKIISLSPDNITIHSFCVKKSAQILQNNSQIYDLEEKYASDSVNYAYSELIKNGYEPYYMYRQKNTVSDLENVGYAKKGAYGIYNVFMMADSHTVYGIGAGATTKIITKNGDKTEINRIFSPKYPYEYCREK